MKKRPLPFTAQDWDKLVEGVRQMKKRPLPFTAQDWDKLYKELLAIPKPERGVVPVWLRHYWYIPASGLLIVALIIKGCS